MTRLTRSSTTARAEKQNNTMSNTTPKLQQTTNYKRFIDNPGQRSISEGLVDKLATYMGEVGFNPSKPITVQKTEDGSHVIIDGHHRLKAARIAGVPYYFVIVDSNGMIPINELVKTWSPMDFLMHSVRLGKEEYIKLYGIMEETGFSLNLALSLTMGGTGDGGNATRAFKSGAYKLKSDKKLRQVHRFAIAFKNASGRNATICLLSSYAMLLGIDDFDPLRMRQAVDQYSNMIPKSGDRQTFLMALEDIYNFHRQVKMPLAFLAKNAKK